PIPPHPSSIAIFSVVYYLLFIHFCPSSYFFTHTAPTDIYPLSLHDALPICAQPHNATTQHINTATQQQHSDTTTQQHNDTTTQQDREEHTSELQSRFDLV